MSHLMPVPRSVNDQGVQTQGNQHCLESRTRALSGSVAAADLNGAGPTDLAVASGNTFGNGSVLLNLGNGTFAAAVTMLRVPTPRRSRRWI